MAKPHSIASRKYNEKSYDRVSLMLPRGCKAKVEAFAKERGMSVNRFINQLIRDTMQVPESEWQVPNMARKMAEQNAGDEN